MAQEQRYSYVQRLDEASHAVDDDDPKDDYEMLFIALCGRAGMRLDIKNWHYVEGGPTCPRCREVVAGRAPAAVG